MDTCAMQSRARCRPALLGYLPRDASFAIPERHLGLHLAQEALTDDRLGRLAEWIDLIWILTGYWS